MPKELPRIPRAVVKASVGTYLLVRLMGRGAVFSGLAGVPFTDLSMPFVDLSLPPTAFHWPSTAFARPFTAFHRDAAVMVGMAPLSGMALSRIDKYWDKSQVKRDKRMG